MNAMFTQASFIAHIRHFANRFSVPLLPLLACTLLAGLALGPVETARAQTDVEPNMPKVDVDDAPTPGANSFGVTSVPWRAHFGEHAAMVLREASPEVKQAAMRDLIAAATTSEEIDLSATVDPLLQVIEQAPSEKLRLNALQALHVIGTEHSPESLYRDAMEKLYRIRQEESSEDVHRAATDVLLDFYGDRKRVYGDEDEKQ